MGGFTSALPNGVDNKGLACIGASGAAAEVLTARLTATNGVDATGGSTVTAGCCCAMEAASCGLGLGSLGARGGCLACSCNAAALAGVELKFEMGCTWCNDCPAAAIAD